MFFTYAQMRAEITNRLKGPSLTSLDTFRVNRWIHDAEDEVAHEVKPKHLQKIYTFNMVSGTSKYYLPFAFNSIQSVLDTTQDLELIETSESEVEAFDPAFSFSGSPYYFWVSQFYNVRAQPSSASVVTAVSTNGGDTQTLSVAGKNSSGEEVNENIVLTGLTPKVTTTSFSELFSISYSSNSSSGTITSTTNAGAVTVSILQPGIQVEDRQTLFLWPTPSATNAVRIRGLRKPRRFLNHPDFPEEYHEGIFLSALKRANYDLMRYTIAEKIHNDEYIPFLARIRQKAGGRASKFSPVISGSVPVIRGGRLPPNYPD